MYKLFNILFFILVFIFFLGVYKYYSSTKNLKVKNFNRNNIDKIINDKISELHTLKNDTNNVILFNESLTEDIKNDKPRSFWNLLKSK